MQQTKLAWLFALLITLHTGAALAQGTPAPTSATPPPPPAAAPAGEAAPAGQPAPAPTAAPAEDMPPPPPCFPPCREGFLCGEGGQCISACNPACGPGERCTADAQCVVDAQVTAAPEAAPQYVPPPAPPPPPEEGVETHDGVMLRFAVGIGGGSMAEELEDGSADGSASGAGLMGSVDIGGAITDELTIHGRIGLLQMYGPALERNGADVDSPVAIDVVAIILGPGVTYNIMPLNLYITAVGGLSVLSYAYDEQDSDFDEDMRDEPTAGFGANLDIGKEWWVTTQTGIGVAGRFWWGTGGAEDDVRGETIKSDRDLLAFGVLFSVTHQ